jgi:hypothetical protein
MPSILRLPNAIAIDNADRADVTFAGRQPRTAKLETMNLPLGFAMANRNATSNCHWLIAVRVVFIELDTSR